MRTRPSVYSHHRHKKFLKAARGFFGARHRLYRTAREVVERAWTFQFKHRKERKREFRRLWIAKISAVVREKGITYSRFMNMLKKADIMLNRKMLAIIAMENPEAFDALIAQLKTQ